MFKCVWFLLNGMETAKLNTTKLCVIGETRWLNWRAAAVGIIPTCWGDVAPTSGTAGRDVIQRSERLIGGDSSPGVRWCWLMDPDWTAEMFLLLLLIIVSATFCHLFFFFKKKSLSFSLLFTFLPVGHQQMWRCWCFFFLFCHPDFAALAAAAAFQHQARPRLAPRWWQVAAAPLTRPPPLHKSPPLWSQSHPPKK